MAVIQIKVNKIISERIQLTNGEAVKDDEDEDEEVDGEVENNEDALRGDEILLL